MDIRERGKAMVARGKLQLSGRERGEVNLAGIMIMGLGFVFIGVGFIVFQIFMDAAEALLDWGCTDNESIDVDSFTGFSDIVGITPLLVLVGFLAAGVFSMYLGVKIAKGAGSTKMDLGVLILLACLLYTSPSPRDRS